MKTLPQIILSLLVGFAAGFYYVAIQNTAGLSYQNGLVDAMSKMCPALIEKFQAPKQGSK